MITKAFLTLSAAGLLAVSPVAYATQPPIKVAACDVQTSYLQESGGDAPLAVPDSATLSINFVNTAPKTVSSVIFDVTDDIGNAYTIKDAGMFTTGVAIDHEFNSKSIGASDAKCAIQKVTFQDGSTWMASSN
jgi:hypothetical protein